jgi:hypothetical protein
MPETAEQKATRVERVLETGDLDGAMKALSREMQAASPQERANILNSLKSQNEKANKNDWTLPNVEITQTTKWLGLKNVEGSYDVKFTQNAAERLTSGANKYNPASKVSDALGGKK